MKEQFRELVDVLVWKHDWQDQLRKVQAHWLPFLLIVLFIMAFYMMTVLVVPGPITYIASAIACFVIGITALARVSDIPVAYASPTWQFRRLGLTMVGAACLGMIFSPLLGAEDWPSWREVLLRWGVMLTWITTPHLPPWWRYISGEFRTHYLDGTPRVRTISSCLLCGQHGEAAVWIGADPEIYCCKACRDAVTASKVSQPNLS